ncbi:unnamed protein product, partial [Ceratitis capitata]
GILKDPPNLEERHISMLSLQPNAEQIIVSCITKKRFHMRLLIKQTDCPLATVE